MQVPTETITADVLLGADNDNGIIYQPVLTWQGPQIIAVAGDNSSVQEEADSKTNKISILAPGFINGHAHLELYRETPVEPASNFPKWLEHVAQEFGPATETDKYKSAKQSALRLLKNGCTFVNDVSSSGQSALALSELGMRGIVNIEYFHPFHVADDERLSRLKNTYDSLCEKWKNSRHIFIGISPHSPYNVSPCGLQSALLQTQPKWVHSHLAESLAEVQWFKTGTGDIDDIHQRFLDNCFGPEQKNKTGFEHFEPILKTLKNTAVTFAHGNYLTSPALKSICNAKWGLFSCPCSNQFFDHAPLNIQQALDNNVLLGLGTDGMVSNYQLDLRVEANLLIAGGSAPETIFKMLTTNAAHALKLGLHTGMQFGRLAKDYAADFVLYEATCESSEMLSVSDVYSLLFRPDTTVQAVWVNGQQVITKSVLVT